MARSEVKVCYRKDYKPAPEQRRQDEKSVADFVDFIKGQRGTKKNPAGTNQGGVK